jgi:hypothetical protein
MKTIKEEKSTPIGGVYKAIDHIINNEMAFEHLQALNELYIGYLKNVLNTEMELQPSEWEVENIGFTYEELKRILSEIVKAEKQIHRTKLKENTK